MPKKATAVLYPDFSIFFVFVLSVTTSTAAETESEEESSFKERSIHLSLKGMGLKQIRTKNSFVQSLVRALATSAYFL
jgi:hypothetical protein